jgi:hypothetical protein
MVKLNILRPVLLAAFWAAFSCVASAQVTFDYNPPALGSSEAVKRSDLDAELDGINGAKQGLDGELTCLAALTSAADKIAYFTGSGTCAVTDFSSFVRTLIDDASSSAARTTLGLVIGTDVQAFDADLSTYADITPAANVQSLLSAADYAAIRTQLGLVIGTNVQAFDADLTTYAGITPAANVQSLLAAANYAAMRALLDLEVGTDFYSISAANAAFQAADADLTTYAGITPSANVQSLLGAADYAAMRTQLGLVIGTNVQAFDGDLSTWAGLTPSANAQSLVTAANYAAMRALLDLEAGTDFYSISAANAAFQALDSDLTTIAGLTATSDNFLQAKSSAWASRTPTQVTADLIPCVGDAGSGGSKGLVPAPVTGDATKFLRGDCTFQSIPGGGDALVANPLSQFASTTSAQFAGVISNETGTGLVVLNDSPTLVTPALGTPSSATLTNATGLPLSGVVDSTSEALGAGTIELGAASDTTLARTGAGAISVEGVGVALNSTSLAHTAGTIELGNASDTTLSRSAAGVLAVEGNKITGLESFCFAMSDETTDLTTGTAKVTFRMPYAFTISAVRASVNDAAAGTLITVDLNEEGTTIMATNKLTIDIAEESSTTAATVAGVTDTAIADDAEITGDIDGVGTTAKGLKVCMIGRQA